ncbi:cytochrome c3 family protein [Paeniroseomonas aquatica]|uniref:cytochrome c3 family protein n=1 Tax=Paeniroseomonas aquatica TaxID=373043 RepID=UPI00360E28E3
MHRFGSEGVPLWTAAANPGPLSAAHDILGAQCEACHVPTRGVEAASCLTCHATAAPELVTKPSTAFHQNIGECAGCHVEHQGRGRRPVNMDHAVLVAAGHSRAATSGAMQTEGRQYGTPSRGSGACLTTPLPICVVPRWCRTRSPQRGRTSSIVQVATPTATRTGRCSAATARAVTLPRLGHWAASGTPRRARGTASNATKRRRAIT